MGSEVGGSGRRWKSLASWGLDVPHFHPSSPSWWTVLNSSSSISRKPKQFPILGCPPKAIRVWETFIDMTFQGNFSHEGRRLPEASSPATGWLRALTILLVRLTTVINVWQKYKDYCRRAKNIVLLEEKRPPWRKVLLRRSIVTKGTLTLNTWN